MVQLSEFVELFVGVALASGHTGVRRHTVSTGDLRAGLTPPLHELPLREVSSSLNARYAARAGDVLVTARGTQMRIALVDPETAGAVVSSTLLVLRPGEKLLPAFLYAALTAPEGMAELSRRVKKSTSTLALTVRDAAQIPIPVPPMEEQAEIAALVQASEQYLRLATAAAERRYSTARSVAWNAIYAGTR